MSIIDPIKVDGLIELQRALKATEDGLQKGLRTALNQAAEIVADDARVKVPRRSGRAAASVKAQSSQREAKIIGGSKKVPYYGWLEFGGKVGQKHATRRPYIQGGRYMYPAYARNRDRMLDLVAAELVAVAAAAGLEMDRG